MASWANRFNSGGHYAPSIASAIMSKKAPGQKRQDDSSSKGQPARKLGVKTVGIINGWIDIAVQADAFPVFAVNNTYGIQAYNQSVADEALAALTAPGGCYDAIKQCRQLVVAKDPKGYLNDPDVVQACALGFQICWGGVYQPFETYSGVSRVSGPSGLLVKRMGC